MAIYPGAIHSRLLRFVNRSDSQPVDISSWEFLAAFKDNVGDAVAIVELTTGNGGIVVIDGPNGLASMAMTAETTDLFTNYIGTAVADVYRTDADPGPVRLFRIKEKIRRPA